MEIEEIDSRAELGELLRAEPRGVLVDFWGTWCQPCRALRPHLERLADDHAASWRIVAVHTDEREDLVETYAIQATPTLIYTRQGKEVYRSAGAVTPSAVAEALTTYA